MNDPIPRHVRPIAFGLTGLLLDVTYLLQAHTKIDLEGLQIVLCVSDATMRPFMNDPTTPETLLNASKPPNAVRGSISRRTIADKTGISRETVRRKVAELTAMDLLQVDENDRIRSVQRLGNPVVQQKLEQCHAAVVHYIEQLEARGIDWRTLPEK